MSHLVKTMPTVDKTKITSFVSQERKSDHQVISTKLLPHPDNEFKIDIKPFKIVDDHELVPKQPKWMKRVPPLVRFLGGAVFYFGLIIMQGRNYKAMSIAMIGVGL